jgi:ABC-type Na+ transport system ATPase subunit NatA
MELVERLCTRIGIMVAGKLLVEETRPELLSRYQAANVEEAFLAAVGADERSGGLEWLNT